VDAWLEVHSPRTEYFAREFSRLSPGEPQWLANPLFWIGCAALFFRKPLWAGVLGALALWVIVIWITEHPDFFGRSPSLGAFMWLASMVFLAASGFYGWLRERRRTGARQPKIGVPTSSFEQNLEGS
jgi:hypothetical protein